MGDKWPEARTPVAEEKARGPAMCPASQVIHGITTELNKATPSRRSSGGLDESRAGRSSSRRELSAGDPIVAAPAGARHASHALALCQPNCPVPAAELALRCSAPHAVPHTCLVFDYLTLIRHCNCLTGFIDPKDNSSLNIKHRCSDFIPSPLNSAARLRTIGTRRSTLIQPL